MDAVLATIIVATIGAATTIVVTILQRNNAKLGTALGEIKVSVDGRLDDALVKIETLTEEIQQLKIDRAVLAKK